MDLVTEDQCKELEFHKTDLNKINPETGPICRPNTGDANFN